MFPVPPVHGLPKCDVRSRLREHHQARVQVVMAKAWLLSCGGGKASIVDLWSTDDLAPSGWGETWP